MIVHGARLLETACSMLDRTVRNPCPSVDYEDCNGLQPSHAAIITDANHSERAAFSCLASCPIVRRRMVEYGWSVSGITQTRQSSPLYSVLILVFDALSISAMSGA